MHPEDMIENMARRYDRFRDNVRQQDPNAAAEEFGKFCHWLRRSNLKISSRVLASFAEAWIDLFWQCRAYEQMLHVAEDAETTFGKDPEWRFAQGEALFNLARFDEARAVLEPLTMEEFEEPMVYYLLGCLAERRGEDEAAQRYFATAHRLSPQEFALPVTLSEEGAVEIYEQSMVELPGPIAWHLKEVPIFISPLPSDELIRSFDPPLDPLLLGVFLGQPRGATESSWASDQPRIMLFHKNIAKIAGDMETVDDELRKTLFHEVGHYLGFDEDQLEEMGLA